MDVGAGVEVVAAAEMVRLRAEVTACGDDSESLTVTLNADVPLAVGLPLMTPLVERVNPAGKDPEARVQT